MLTVGYVCVILSGGGFKDVKDSMRPMADVMPAGVDWLQTSVTGFDPQSSRVTTADGKSVQYDYLVVVRWEEGQIA